MIDMVMLTWAIAVYVYVFLITFLATFWVLDEDFGVKVVASFIFSVLWGVTIPAYFLSKIFSKRKY